MTADAAASFPRPSLGGDGAPFWHAAAGGRLDIQACSSCGALRHPPRPVCAQCGATGTEWRAVSGLGEVWSFTVVHRPTLPAFDPRVPYVALVVRLAEGPFLVSRLADDAAASRVAVGTPVEVVFHRIDDDLAVPLFRPAADPVG